MLCDRCFICPVLSCLAVCNVGVLWPNGWMEWIKMPLGMEVCLGPGQNVLHGDSSPSKGAQQPLPHFSVHVHCGQTAGWIKIPFGTEVGLGPCHIGLDGDPAPLFTTPLKRGHSSPHFSAHICCDQTVAHLSYC